VWFIRDHFLYEITTYKELEPWLEQILSGDLSEARSGAIK